MKCWSRSTLGVVVGILNIVACIGIAIFAVIVLTKLEATQPDNDRDRNEIAKTTTIFIIILVLSLIMALISGIFMVGIIKRLHKLMMPWLILSGLSFVIQCGRFIFTFFGAMFTGVPFVTVLINLVVGLLSIGFSALILWPLFTLFGDIRKNNIEGPGRKMLGS